MERPTKRLRRFNKCSLRSMVHMRSPGLSRTTRAVNETLWLCTRGGQGNRLPGKIYVVDDDASFRSAIQQRLQKDGYHVETFSSAQQLLDRRPCQSEPGRPSFCNR